MINKILRVVSIVFSILVFTLFVKIFYFDTKIGYDTKILGFTYFSLPNCIYAFFGTLIMPIIAYLTSYNLLFKLFNYKKSK